MNYRKQLFGTIAIALLTGVYSTYTVSGVINKELADKLATTPVAGESDPKRSSLRCWQNGKLLFEEMDWQSFSINNKTNVLSFEHKLLSNQTLSLIDLGESVCLYRRIDK
jgi:hypothetical protein